MKKLMLIAVAAVALVGCTTYIEATKNPEAAHPIQKVVEINGSNAVVTTGYMVTSGGWEAKSSSPLWATEALNGLAIGVHTNGSVTLSLDKYDRDLSDNAVAITHELTDGAVNLASKIAAAIVTGGGSPAAEGIGALVKKFISSGGDPSKAKVTVTDGVIECTDGSCREVCADGSCSE